MIAVARSKPPRPLREFAENEIIIPDGPWANFAFRCDRQPYSAILFDAVSSGRWKRHVFTGSVQSGKSLHAFVILALYHLFEIGETVVLGIPTMDMAQDKWRQDLLPVIESSRYRELLPSDGTGSRGGRTPFLRFKNGATLRWMSAGGDDKSRSGFTTRVVIVTETDGLDEASSTSREASPFTQIEARTEAYGEAARVYMECTVSTEKGRTWREYQASTRSRLAVPCPHCAEWVTPEREHLVGWANAPTESDARELGGVACPECGKRWSEDERVTANQRARLVHGGQSIDASGQVVGEEPKTDTFGLRWNAANNLFIRAGDVAAREWSSANSIDNHYTEKALLQFTWALPAKPDAMELVDLDADDLLKRVSMLGRGFVPPNTQHLTVGVDVGKWRVHWVAVAWGAEARAHVIDYDTLEVDSRKFGEERAIMLALRELGDRCDAGWPAADIPDQYVRPKQVWIDAGYNALVVQEFCRAPGKRYRPCVGRGTSQLRGQRYHQPRTTGNIVKHVGDRYHAVWMAEQKLHQFEIDVDHWKGWVHERLATPLGSPGAMSFYGLGPRNEHLGLVKHLLAERAEEVEVAGAAPQTRWVRHGDNHWFDCSTYASAAGHFCGVRVLPPTPQAAAKPRTAQPQARPPARNSGRRGPWAAR